MAKGIFITATGTDVGKTYISALLLKSLRQAGLNAGYYKPVLSGALSASGGRLIPGDCDFVLKFAKLNIPPENYVSYIYKEPFSPHLAAQIENNPVELSKIVSDFNNIKKQFDYIIVEGAGGIVCPFRLDNHKIMLPDVIKALGMDIIIIASAALGTINSTFLTVEYAKNCGINVCGIVLNNYDDNDIMMRDNLKQIEALTGVKVIAVVEKSAQDIDFNIQIFKEI